MHCFFTVHNTPTPMHYDMHHQVFVFELQKAYDEELRIANAAPIQAHPNQDMIIGKK